MTGVLTFKCPHKLLHKSWKLNVICHGTKPHTYISFNITVPGMLYVLWIQNAVSSLELQFYLFAASERCQPETYYTNVRLTIRGIKYMLDRAQTERLMHDLESFIHTFIHGEILMKKI